jgi:hypothetical protein
MTVPSYPSQYPQGTPQFPVPGQGQAPTGAGMMPQQQGLTFAQWMESKKPDSQWAHWPSVGGQNAQAAQQPPPMAGGGMPMGGGAGFASRYPGGFVNSVAPRADLGAIFGNTQNPFYQAPVFDRFTAGSPMPQAQTPSQLPGQQTPQLPPSEPRPFQPQPIERGVGGGYPSNPFGGNPFDPAGDEEDLYEQARRRYQQQTMLR